MSDHHATSRSTPLANGTEYTECKEFQNLTNTTLTWRVTQYITSMDAPMISGYRLFVELSDLTSTDSVWRQ